MVAQKEPVNPNTMPRWIKKKSLPKVTSSWHNYMCQSVVQDFQQTVLEVSESPIYDNTISNHPNSFYEFPNGYNQVIILNYKLI